MRGLARGLLQPHHRRATWATTCFPRARARRCGWCCWTRAPTPASASWRARSWPSAILDVIVLGDDAGGRGLRRPARRRAAHRPAAADRGDRRGAVRAGAGGRGASSAAAARSPACATSPARWPTPPAPSRAGRACPLLAASVRALARARAPSTWPSPRLWSSTSAPSGALYLVALTNFVAALPAAPGSIGTFDAAVAFGAKALGGSGSLVISPTCCSCASSSTCRSRWSASSCCWSATAAGRGCARRRGSRPAAPNGQLGPNATLSRPAAGAPAPRERLPRRRPGPRPLRPRQRPATLRRSGPMLARAPGLPRRCRRSRCCSRPRPPTTRGPGSCGGARSCTWTWSPRAARRGSRCRCSSPRPSRSSAQTVAPYLWLWIARAGALLALVDGVPPGPPADRRGAARAWSPAWRPRAFLLTTYQFVRDSMLGNSEAMLAALALWAFERHLDGRRDHALYLGFAAALLRPGGVAVPRPLRAVAVVPRARAARCA